MESESTGRHHAAKITRRNAALQICTSVVAASVAAAMQTEAGMAGGLHFPARVKRIIFLFMHGGVSHIDSFDYKPLLERDDGKPLPFAKPRVQFAQTGNLLKSPWKFRQHGQCGAWVSELFPEVAKQVDHLTFLKSLHGSNEAHGGALLKIHTGSDTFVRPSMGAWVSYGLGSENENLPSFITINPTLGHGGVQNFGAAFLPAQHQATRIGSSGKLEEPEGISNLANGRIGPEELRHRIDLASRLESLRHSSQLGDDAISSRLSAMELAFRMQSEAPQLLRIDGETEATRRLYGLDRSETAAFGKQCLLARRLSEAGVRFVQVSHAYWDQHDELREKHKELAGQVDLPIAGLLADLRQRGLMEETLVLWGTEFGRTPTAQGNNGRDHNPHAFTWWMAGPGIRPGVSWGATDEYGFYAQQDRVHVHDLHATLLHLLGIDHQRLTFPYGGREFRLTDVHGTIVRDILS
ncbi:MAG: DUF1501 domain-containing protein [Pirellulaceae bacterium]